MQRFPEKINNAVAGHMLDHIAIAVRDITAASGSYTDLFPGAFTAGPVYQIPEQGACLRFLVGAGTKLELVQPMNNNGKLAKFLSRRGEGLHHVCFAVACIEDELARLLADGAELIDRTPRPGHDGRVAFVHPRAAHGVLLELLEQSSASMDAGGGEGRSGDTAS